MTPQSLPMSSARRPLFGAALLTVALLVGCGDSGCTVSGEVSYEGVPVEDGNITFLPADGKGTPVGAPISAGRYSVTGMAPGKKVVQITSVKKLTFAKTREEARTQKGNAGRAELIPAKAQGNNTTVEVKPGPQQLNFPLKKPAPPKS